MLRPGATPGYCVGLLTPAKLAGIVAVRSTWQGQLRYAVPPPVWRGAPYRYLGYLRPRVSLLHKTAFEMPQKRVHLWQEPFEETNVECPARGGVAHIAHDP